MTKEQIGDPDEGGLGALASYLPDPIYRFELRSPLPLSAPVPQLREALLDGTLLTYHNEAFAALHGAKTTLQGCSLRDLGFGRHLANLRDLTRFQSDGRHETPDLRIVVDEVPRFFRSVPVARQHPRVGEPNRAVCHPDVGTHPPAR